MQKINFITKERVRVFHNDKYLLLSLAMFLDRFFNRDMVFKVLSYFDIRMDTRYIYKGKFPAVVPFKDFKGKIRDVILYMFDYETGEMVKRGDSNALKQNEYKQNQYTKYYPYYGATIFSLGAEMTKGYNWVKTPTFFGLDKIGLPGNEHKTVHAVKSVFDVILMTIIYPHTLWIASGGSEGLGCSLTDPSVLTALSGRKVILHPQFGAYYGARPLEEILLGHGIQADTDAFLEYTDYEGKKNRDTLGQYILLQLQAGVSIDEIKVSLNIEG